jgi:hypothetical protein
VATGGKDGRILIWDVRQRDCAMQIETQVNLVGSGFIVALLGAASLGKCTVSALRKNQSAVWPAPRAYLLWWNRLRKC